MSGEFSGSLDRLTRVPGVRGALVIDCEAGVPVAGELQADVEGGALAALAGSLLRRAARATEAPGLGGLRAVQVVSEHGQLVAVMAPRGLAVVVLADARAPLGLVRLEARRAMEALS